MLLLFALLAGAATALSPCILPVLPIVLGVGATGGRRRPLGIVIGLTLSFTAATLLLAYVIAALGLPDTLARGLAIAVLAGFGLTLLVPSLAARVEGSLSRLAGRMPVPSGGEGFGSGVVVGLALGVVYAPCAGPILAAVITTSAAQPLTGQRAAVALAYGIGTGLVLYLLMLGGRRLTRPLARRAGRFQQAIGALMVGVAALMAADVDVRFQSELASRLPPALVNPTGSLERAADPLALARLSSSGPPPGSAAARAAALPQAERDALPDLGAAPQFAADQRWFNTAGDRPLTLSALRGKVVLVDFWTYSCINCLRTLPVLKAYDARYRDDGLVVVGVHAPEFPFERDPGNVADAIEREGIRYPVVQDNDFATWNAYGNRFWPATYLIDARGRLRYYRPGEGAYEQKDAAIRRLLAERGARPMQDDQPLRAPTAADTELTPELYLGAGRITRVAGARADREGAVRAARWPARQPVSTIAFAGDWRLRPAHAVAGDAARLRLRFRARRVFLVAGRGRTDAEAVLKLRLDGRPLTAGAGGDVRGGRVQLAETRLYRLLDLPEVRDGTLDITATPGAQLYALTFG